MKKKARKGMREERMKRETRTEAIKVDEINQERVRGMVAK